MSQCTVNSDNIQNDRLFNLLTQLMTTDRSFCAELLDLIPIALSVSTDPSCNNIIHNRKTAEFLRIQRGETLRKSRSPFHPATVFYHGKKLNRWQMPIERSCWKGERVEGMELEFLWNDGVRKISRWNSYPLYDERGTIIGAIASVEDITAIKTSVEKARHQKALLNGINRILQQALTCETEEELGKTCISVALELTGSRYGFLNEVDTTGCLHIIAQCLPDEFATNISENGLEDRKYTKLRVRGIYGRVVRDGKSLFTNQPASHPDSVGVPEYHPPLNSFIGSPLIQNGKIIGLIGLANKAGGYDCGDIDTLETLTQSIVQVLMRKRAENKIAKAQETLLSMSEEKFYQAFHNNQTMMMICRVKDGVIIDANNVCEKITGYKREEVIGTTIFDPSRLIDEKTYVDDEIRKNEYLTVESQLTKKSGEIRYTINSFTKIHVSGEPCLLISTIDITDRKQLENALRESQECFYKMFHNSPDIVFLISIEDYKYVAVNQKFSETFEYNPDEIINKTADAVKMFVDGPNCITPVHEILRENKSLTNIKIRCCTKSGKTKFALCSTETIYFKGKEHRLVLVKDITNEQILEAQMAHLDRLHLVGEMAAAIGHEVRNPMTTVRGFLQLFQKKPEFVKYGSNLSLMIEELDRANAIITEFLTLARNKKSDKKWGQLNDIITNILPLLQADALKNDKHISVQLGELPELLLDEKEIRQLLHNLVRNGFEAMEPGGTVTVKTFSQNREIVLQVIDQGSGMLPDVVKKLGTPFFTTKETGTGLGLAVCYSIADRHNAQIDVETGPEGSIFTVRFNIE